MIKADLARLTEYKKEISESGKQLHNVTVRFILLECEKDYERICKKTMRPVHVIQYEDGRYLWMKSNKSLNSVRGFIKNDSGKYIDEKEMVSRITSLSIRSGVCISDSPGMGKTLVLNNLASEAQLQNPNNIVLFIVLREFAKNIHSVVSTSSVLEAVAEYSSCCKVTKMILLEMLTRQDYHLFLFLDGYDEVMQNESKLVDSFLKQMHELERVNVILTTRPHLQTHLELIFSQLSYQIRPFHLSNQIDFLTRYWADQCGAHAGNVLEEFARQCLSTLLLTLTDKEKGIAGVPLQCRMLAEVYAEDARRASELDTLHTIKVSPISLFDMYKKLVKLKFERIGKGAVGILEKLKNSFPWRRPTINECDLYLNAHVYQATELLFPNWVKKFQPLFQNNKEIDENTLYTIGLVEKTPDAGTPRFVHRTFAEYLFAEFIVKNLNKCAVCVDLLFKEILGQEGTIRKRSIHQNLSYFDLRYPTIAYFVEMHLSEQPISDLIFQPTSTPSDIISDDVCVAALTCCINDFGNSFDYISKILQNFVIEEQHRHDYFNDLAYVVVELSENVTVLKKVLDFEKQKLEIDWRDNIKDNWKLGSIVCIPNCSLLHVAVFMGKYNMVTYLVQEYGDQVGKLKYLLHACVHDSSRNSEAVIEDKLLIVDMLVKINPDWLEDKVEALLQLNVHFSLLKRLVEHGADINAHEGQLGTVLHRSDDKSVYTNIARWAFSCGFNLVNDVDEENRTPLMYALHTFGVIEDEVFTLFHNAGADFNAQDRDGDSVLFYALRYSGSGDVIKKLLEYGANASHKNKMKENALHQIIQGCGTIEYKLDTMDMLVTLDRRLLEERDMQNCTPLLEYRVHLNILQCLVKHGADINAYDVRYGTVLHRSGCKDTNGDLVRWAISNGFKLINHTDDDGRTPLMYIISVCGSVDDDMLKLFHEAGTDFNAQDTVGNSVLFYGIEFSVNPAMVEKLIDYGANVNHTNDKMENAVHKTINGKGPVEAKLNIIDILVRSCNRNLLDEVDIYQRPPLIQENCNFSLAKHLVQHGADINAYESSRGTVLHFLGDKETYMEFVRWALSNGFTALNRIDDRRRTPLMHAIKEFGTIDNDVLELLYEAGADFNAQTNAGNSVLFYALLYSNSIDFIGKILEYGVNVNHMNRDQENVAHVIIRYESCAKTLNCAMRLLVSEGFKGFDQKDSQGNTPLNLAEFYEPHNEELIAFLKQHTDA